MQSPELHSPLCSSAIGAAPHPVSLAPGVIGPPCLWPPRAGSTLPRAGRADVHMATSDALRNPEETLCFALLELQTFAGDVIESGGLTFRLPVMIPT